MNKPLRVLLLEDSVADAELLLRVLRREGYSVTHRREETREGVRDALAHGTWDVALSDYNMPQLSVTDALDILHKQGIDIPFIIVSGSVGEEIAVSAMKAGAHDFFLKDRTMRLGSAIERELREAEIRAERRVAMQRLQERERQLEEAVRIRDEFISIASHELRTPLTPLVLEVASALDLVRRKQSGPAPDLSRIEAKLANCIRQVERLTTLINNMLDVTKITSGRLLLSPTEIDLREVVFAVIDRMAQSIARSGSQVTVDAAGPVVGTWDRDGIETVLVNLLGNAVKFGEGKPIDVSLEVFGDRARLVMRDRGIGIAPEQQRRIFERFERAVSTQHYGGFGIGLWIARQLVEAHGGTIRVSSVPGTGSRFEVELPLRTG
jgi:signal transduction histidine kinase